MLRTLSSYNWGGASRSLAKGNIVEEEHEELASSSSSNINGKGKKFVETQSSGGAVTLFTTTVYSGTFASLGLTWMEFYHKSDVISELIMDISLDDGTWYQTDFTPLTLDGSVTHVGQFCVDPVDYENLIDYEMYYSVADGFGAIAIGFADSTESADIRQENDGFLCFEFQSTMTGFCVSIWERESENQRVRRWGGWRNAPDMQDLQNPNCGAIQDICGFIGGIIGGEEGRQKGRDIGGAIEEAIEEHEKNVEKNAEEAQAEVDGAIAQRRLSNSSVTSGNILFPLPAKIFSKNKYWYLVIFQSVRIALHLYDEQGNELKWSPIVSNVYNDNGAGHDRIYDARGKSGNPKDGSAPYGIRGDQPNISKDMIGFMVTFNMNEQGETREKVKFKLEFYFCTEFWYVSDNGDWFKYNEKYWRDSFEGSMKREKNANGKFVYVVDGEVTPRRTDEGPNRPEGSLYPESIETDDKGKPMPEKRKKADTENPAVDICLGGIDNSDNPSNKEEK